MEPPEQGLAEALRSLGGSLEETWGFISQTEPAYRQKTLTPAAPFQVGMEEQQRAGTAGTAS